MSTISDSELSYSGDAIDLLDCFSSGFDDFLSDVASQICAQRGGDLITADDIRSAASSVSLAVAKSDLSDEAKNAFAKMLGCLAIKSK